MKNKKSNSKEYVSSKHEVGNLYYLPLSEQQSKTSRKAKPLHYDPNIHPYVTDEVEETKTYISTLASVLKKGIKKIIPGLGAAALLASCTQQPMQYALSDYDRDGQMDKVMFTNSNDGIGDVYLNLGNNQYQWLEKQSIDILLQVEPRYRVEKFDGNGDGISDYRFFQPINNKVIVEELTNDQDVFFQSNDAPRIFESKKYLQ